MRLLLGYVLVSRLEEEDPPSKKTLNGVGFSPIKIDSGFLPDYKECISIRI